MSTEQDSKTAPRWRYRQISAEDHVRFIDGANLLGAEGWELVHVEIIHALTVGFFKREA